MKKFLSILGVVLIIVVCFILPVSASSSIVTIPEFDPIYINSNPSYLDCFSDLNYDLGDNFYWSRSVFTDFDYAPCTLYPMFLDVDGNLLDISSVTLQVYSEGEIEDTLTSNSNYITFDPYDYRASRSFRLVTTGYNATFCCAILIPYSTTPEIESLVSTYQSSFLSLLSYSRGYDAGSSSSSYWSGFNAGVNSGFSDGFSEGESAGYSSGYSSGYSVGYSDGAASVDPVGDLSAYRSAVWYTVSAPFQAISNFLNFEILGINLKALFAFILTAIIVVFVIKHFIK